MNNLLPLINIKWYMDNIYTWIKSYQNNALVVFIPLSSPLWELNDESKNHQNVSLGWCIALSFAVVDWSIRFIAETIRFIQWIAKDKNRRFGRTKMTTVKSYCRSWVYWLWWHPVRQKHRQQQRPELLID